jgi:hypothetical protein
VEVRVVVVVPPAISLLTFTLFSFNAIPPFTVAVVFLSALVLALHHTRRGRALEWWERGRRCRLAVRDAPKPTKTSLLWFADGDVRVKRVGGDIGIVVDLPKVYADVMADTCQEEEEPSMEPVVNVSHITLGMELGLAVQAQSSMPRVSVGWRRLVSMHCRAHVRPTRRSTMSGSQACRGTPSRTMRTR